MQKITIQDLQNKGFRIIEVWNDDFLLQKKNALSMPVNYDGLNDLALLHNNVLVCCYTSPAQRMPVKFILVGDNNFNSIDKQEQPQPNKPISMDQEKTTRYPGGFKENTVPLKMYLDLLEKKQECELINKELQLIIQSLEDKILQLENSISEDEDDESEAGEQIAAPQTFISALAPELAPAIAAIAMSIPEWINKFLDNQKNKNNGRNDETAYSTNANTQQTNNFGSNQNNQFTGTNYPGSGEFFSGH
jgi:hypothetical protein